MQVINLVPATNQDGITEMKFCSDKMSGLSIEEVTYCLLLSWEYKPQYSFVMDQKLELRNNTKYVKTL